MPRLVTTIYFPSGNANQTGEMISSRATSHTSLSSNMTWISLYRTRRKLSFFRSSDGNDQLCEQRLRLESVFVKARCEQFVLIRQAVIQLCLKRLRLVDQTGSDSVVFETTKIGILRRAPAAIQYSIGDIALPVQSPPGYLPGTAAPCRSASSHPLCQPLLQVGRDSAKGQR